MAVSVPKGRTGELEVLGLVLDAMASESERMIAVPCRYCRADCEMVGAFVEVLSAWNALAPEQPPIRKGDVMVCPGCHERWVTEVVARAASETSDVQYVCTVIRAGDTPHIPHWMLEQHWASELIRRARAYANKRTRGNELS